MKTKDDEYLYYNLSMIFDEISQKLNLSKANIKAIDSCHNNGNANVFISFMLKVIKETIINTTQKKTRIQTLQEMNLQRL